MSQETSGATAWPTVTGIIPTKDRPELLKRAVRSLFDQDYEGHLEVIVVFDGTDPVDIGVDVPENRSLRTMRNSRTPGLAGNRNTGYLAATGTYVGGCDDDDEWLPAKVRRQVELLQSRPDAILAATGMYVHYRGEDIRRDSPAHDLHLQDFLRHRYPEVNASAFLIERERLLTEIGLVDEELPGGYGEDYEFLMRASRLGPVVCIPDPLTRIHFHDQSFYVSRWQTIDKALKYILDRVPEFHDEPAGLARIEGQLAFANAAMGQRSEAVGYASRSLRRAPTTKHSYAALLVASGLVSADKVAAMARQRGRGI
ncbi:MAG TPA: glycosyltransferase family 2 protein [Candidatus Nanopelagicales bacterium]|nr:glycosyltransferase family 2 protein [Candidatus Nanopelagicales bacterium]